METENVPARGDQQSVEKAAKVAAQAELDTGEGSIGAAVVAQGELVRKLKADRAAKTESDEAIKKLLALKAEYKSITGSEWKQDVPPPVINVADLEVKLRDHHNTRRRLQSRYGSDVNGYNEEIGESHEELKKTVYNL